MAKTNKKLLSKLTRKEFAVLKYLFNPKSAVEILFPNGDNLTDYNKTEFGRIRLQQLPYLSYEYMIVDDPKLNKKQNFARKVGAGTTYVLGGRMTGKSYCVKLTDIPLSMTMNRNFLHILASYDNSHMEGIFKPVMNILDNHPFFSLFNNNINQTKHTIENKLGNKLTGISENIMSKNPGHMWERHHVHKEYYEEFSATTNEASKKASMSRTELGEPIKRFSGITNFSKTSPAGKIWTNKKLKPWITNCPAFSNPNWDDKAKQKAVEIFGSETDIGYRVHINGEFIEDQESAFDMSEVRKCFNDKKTVKSFAVDKKSYDRFKSLIILGNRPEGVEKVILGADIGEMATPSELAVFYKVNGKWYYVYNITLTMLKMEQQREIFRFVIDKLRIEIISLDSGGGVGVCLAWELEKIYGKERVIQIKFQSNINVKFDTDNEGNIRRDLQGNKKYITEQKLIWGVICLKNLFYNKLIEVPTSDKLEWEMGNYATVMSNGKEKFYSKIAQDHLMSAFLCFALAQYMTENMVIDVAANYYAGCA